MKFGIPAQAHAGETRVAATPETVKKLAASGLHTMLVQSGAGAGTSIPDEFKSRLRRFRGCLDMIDPQHPAAIRKGNSCLRS
jgi:hypothetical protein